MSFIIYLFDKSNLTPNHISKTHESIWDFIERNEDLYWDYSKLSSVTSFNWDFFQRHIHKSWNWDILSSRTDINLSIVLKNDKKNWNWTKLSDNPSISLDEIEAHPNYFWCFDKREVPLDVMSKCLRYLPSPNQQIEGKILKYPIQKIKTKSNIIPNTKSSKVLNWKFIRKHHDNQDWATLSSHSDLHVSFIFNFPDKAWDWMKLSRQVFKSQSVKMTKLVEKFHDKPWDWEYLSSRSDIDLSLLYKFPNKSWDWKGMMIYRPLVVMQLIKDFPDKPWYYESIAKNKSIKMNWDIVYNTIEKWDIQTLFYNHGHNWDLVIKFPDKWSKSWKSLSKIVDWDTLQKYPDLPWDFKIICKKSDIPWNMVIKTASILNWNWGILSNHYSLKLELVKRHAKYPWNRFVIKKRFDFLIDEYMAIIKIKRAWLRAYYDPQYVICRNRLKREFAELSSTFLE